jgi:DNA polymerase-3 subunit alpha
MEMLCTPLEQLNQGLGQFKDKEITIAGIIIDIKTGKTSKGTDYGRVTIEDFSGTYELAFYGKDYIKWHNFFSAETAICIKGKVGPKWGKEGNELALSIQMMDLLETITENTIRSITLQVQIEQLTSSDVTEIYNLFAVNVMAEKESKEEKKQNQKENNKDIPLHFELYDYDGNYIKMFSRTCKIKKSKELYNYFKNNDAVKMKIN